MQNLLTVYYGFTEPHVAVSLEKLKKTNNKFVGLCDFMRLTPPRPAILVTAYCWYT